MESGNSKSQYCLRAKVDVSTPTNKSFHPNVLSAHLQCCIWKHADDANPPDIDPTMHQHGLKRDVINKTLTPTLLPANTHSAPDSILQLIKYGCESSARCSCSRAMLPCTICCGCEGGLDCSNEHTKITV